MKTSLRAGNLVARLTDCGYGGGENRGVAVEGSDCGRGGRRKLWCDGGEGAGKWRLGLRAWR